MGPMGSRSDPAIDPAPRLARNCAKGALSLSAPLDLDRFRGRLIDPTPRF